MNRTNRAIGIGGWSMRASLLLAAVLVIAAASAAGGIDRAVIRIDGEPMLLAGFGIGHGLVALACIALALLVLVLLVPVAVLIPLAIAAVAVIGALLLAAGVLAMVFSPLILLGLIVWFAVRRTRRGVPAHRDRDATIAE